MFYSIREIGALQRKTKSTVSKLSCYMMVSAKECMDVWSAKLLLSSHSAQNPLDMDNDWMYANLGITKSVESMFNSGINQYVEHLEI